MKLLSFSIANLFLSTWFSPKGQQEVNSFRRLTSSQEDDRPELNWVYFYHYDENKCKGNANYIFAIVLDSCMTIYDTNGIPASSMKATCNKGNFHLCIFPFFFLMSLSSFSLFHSILSVLRLLSL
jgi:hypothetical protein